MAEAAVNRILVIDDEATHRILAKEYLEEAGYQVRLAEDGPRGLSFAKRTKPDLILVDLLVPGVDGFGLCRMLRASEETAHVPIILITASREPDVISRGFEAGADDFITKPVDWEFLADRVAHVLAKAQEKQRLLRETQAAMLELQRTASSPAVEGILAEAPPDEGKATSDGADKFDGIEIEALLQAAENEIADMERRHNDQISTLQSQLTTRHSEEFEAIQQKHVAELIAIKSEHLSAIRTAGENALTEITAEHQVAQSLLNDRMTSMRLEADARIKVLEQNHARHANELRLQADAAVAAARFEGRKEREEFLIESARRIRDIERNADKRANEARTAAEARAKAKVASCWEYAHAATSLLHDHMRSLTDLLRSLPNSQSSDEHDGGTDLIEIERRALTLSSCIAGMRTLSQALAGGGQLRETSFELAKMTRDAVEKLKPLASARQIEVRALSPAGEVWVHADEARVQFAMLSMMLNAIQFSPSGETVAVSVTADAQSGSCILVEDRGIGIASPLLEQLRSCLEHPTLSTNGDTMGFGIPVSTALVASLGGRLEIDSRIGAGTRAAIRLPPTRLRPASCGPTAVPQIQALSA